MPGEERAVSSALAWFGGARNIQIPMNATVAIVIRSTLEVFSSLILFPRHEVWFFCGDYA